MKSYKLFAGLLASGMGLAALTQSCVSDEPFVGNDGSGTLKLQLVVNSEVTRAADDNQDLENKCVIYISGPEGLLHKYKGLGEVPGSISLKSGNYVAEAWTGDSVPASFSDKFYRGYKKFAIESQSSRQVVLNCKIANVVVSVDPSAISEEDMKDWKLTVSNSSGQLAFDAENYADSKGYFMMPDADIAYMDGQRLCDDEGWSYYTNLNYRIEGVSASGQPFSKTGAVASPEHLNLGNIVEHAHEYVLKLQYNPQYEEEGGSLISIVIEDNTVVVEEEIGLYSRPSIKGVGYDIAKQVVVNKSSLSEQVVRIAGFGGIESILVSSDDYEALNLPFGYDSFDLMQLAESAVEEIEALGITWSYEEPKGENKPFVSYLRFSPAFFAKIAERSEEYHLNFHVVDKNGRANDAVLRLAVGNDAIVEEDPLTVFAPENLLSVRSRRATISGSVNALTENMPVFLYRVAGSEVWQQTEIPYSVGNFEINLTGLNPETRYEYAGKVGDVIYGKQEFTTESEFEIPYGNMETWGQAKNNRYILFPGDNYDDESVQFWDSGNHGSATLNKTLTNASTDFSHSPSNSAKLLSQFVAPSLLPNLGKFAAGNLFVGRFGSTDGMSGANLQFGKPYDGSHPDALSVWVKYDPAIVDNASNSVSQLKEGDPDQGQIYIAFATKPADLQTGKGVYFDMNDPSILGYGEKTWKDGEAAGSASSLEEIQIPITWREGASRQAAKYIIIVCSASKFGDYFVGGAGSVMYLDDFSLIYK